MADFRRRNRSVYPAAVHLLKKAVNKQLLFERETILEDIAAQADALPSGQKNN